ncbi:MAG: dTDP-glucose 4,6-dehydratase [Clostridia bacterium]|nr:dTDP-glucose 4,6-dehydratase [Clostridia bacterium]
MKILVTGAMGFIGTNFLKYMQAKYPDYEFVGIDNLSVEDSKNNLNCFNGYKNYKFVKEDITNEKNINKIFKKEKFDMVVNFAAEVAVDYSIENPNIFLKTNIIGTAILMNACLKYNVKRFHQISTDEVYGDLPVDSTLKFDENAILKPSNPYSASKAGADLLVLSYCRTYGLNATISRCTNNYGPHQSYRALIPLTIKNCMQNKTIPIFGDGKYVRDWIYVLDHIKAIDLILHQGSIGQIYNVSGNCKKNNLYVVNKIIRQMDKDKGLISFVKDRPGHDAMYSINSRKIEKELKWKREYSFEDGIAETIKWYVDKLE